MIIKNNRSIHIMLFIDKKSVELSNFSFLEVDFQPN